MTSPPVPDPVVSVVTDAVKVPKGVVPITAAGVVVECTSLKSTSVKAITPSVINISVGAGAVVSSVTAPVTVVAATTGASFVPRIVSVTVSWVRPPCVSVMSIVYVCTIVSPTPSESIMAWSAASRSSNVHSIVSTPVGEAGVTRPAKNVPTKVPVVGTPPIVVTDAPFETPILWESLISSSENSKLPSATPSDKIVPPIGAVALSEIVVSPARPSSAPS